MAKIYITGDTHGEFARVKMMCRQHCTSQDDVLIILGDAGFNYFEDMRDDLKKFDIARQPITVFCIHGNHEARPTSISGYCTKKFRGGKVWYQPEYSNILFAKDGEVYTFCGKQCLVIGGAYSVDKEYRILHGWRWFSDEQPDKKTKRRVEEKIASLGNKVDVVLSHTCPRKYEPTEVFMEGVDQSAVDKSTEDWLDRIEDTLQYEKWYCGHFHTGKKVDKMQFMFDDVALFGKEEKDSG